MIKLTCAQCGAPFQYDVDDVVEQWGKIISVAKGRFLALPMRLASKLVEASDLRQAEDIVKDGIIEVLEELSSHDY